MAAVSGSYRERAKGRIIAPFFFAELGGDAWAKTQTLKIGKTGVSWWQAFL